MKLAKSINTALFSILACGNSLAHTDANCSLSGLYTIAHAKPYGDELTFLSGQKFVISVTTLPGPPAQSKWSVFENIVDNSDTPAAAMVRVPLCLNAELLNNRELNCHYYYNGALNFPGRTSERYDIDQGPNHTMNLKLVKTVPGEEAACRSTLEKSYHHDPMQAREVCSSTMPGQKYHCVIAWKIGDFATFQITAEGNGSGSGGGSGH